MKNTTGLYKHQRDNRGKRHKLPAATTRAKLVPVTKYDYEIARERATASPYDCGGNPTKDYPGE